MKKQLVSIALLVSVVGTMGAMQRGEVYNYNGGTKPVSMTPARVAPVAVPAAAQVAAPQAPALQATPKAAAATVVAKRSCQGGKCARKPVVKVQGGCRNGRCGFPKK